MSDFQLPAHLASRQARALASDLGRLQTGAVPYLSIKGGRFTLVDAVGEQRGVGYMHAGAVALDVVIVDSNPNMSKVYYENAYDPNASEMLPPTCWSDNGVGPSSQAQKPQAPLCASCPNNQWGSETSRLTGKPTKACNDVKKLAVLIPGEDIVFQLRVPPASLKHLGKYAATVGAQSAGGRKVDITDLITRITFEPKSVGVLLFQPVAFIDETTAVRVDKVWENHEADVLVGKLDKPFSGPVTPIAATAGEERRLPPPAASPAPITELRMDGPAQSATDTDTAPEPEPKKRGRGRPKKEETQQPATQAPFMAEAAKPAGDDLDLPDFLRRDPPPPVADPRPSFGMEPAQTPDDDMAERIRKAMELPT